MLRIKLFGSPEISIDAQSLSAALTGRRLALFAYLLSQEQPTLRSVLSNLLWTDLSEAQARYNLRSLLSHTRRVVGDYVLAEQQVVFFNRTAPYWADVEAFGTFFANRPTNADPALLSETLQLYRGEFLAGFSIQEAPRFEGWLLAQRQRWHEQAVQGWHQLAHYYFTQGDDATGLVTNARLLALEPWHEAAHRRQMLMLARSGQRDAALAYFDHCCAILRAEVDAPPDAETVTLYEQIKAGAWSPNGSHPNPSFAPITVVPSTPAQLPSQAPLQNQASNGHPGAVAAAIPPTTMAPATVTPTARSIAIDWGSMPHEPRFYGRQAELARLHQWCVHERRRVVTVLGVGGQGKSALAVRFIRTLTEAPMAGQQAAGDKATLAFERVIWRSLLAAPPLTDILQDWLQQLSDQQVVTRPPTIDQQFTLLHDYLQRRRFLLVLDNIESILLDDGSGACRPGYEAYEQLWQFFAQRDHQCSLLLTSRERPRVFSSHEEQAGTVRTLLLDGLALADGQQLLRTHRVVGDEAAIAALLQCYSGNPLALKLVADMIDELFDGNMEAFLQEETPFFADIGAVLDQQFARLSPLEIELLTWLALEQEPVTSQMLWENLAAPPAKRDFLAALRTLVRRSLVQTQGELFSLQNVILEYTRNRLVHLIGEELTNDKMTSRQDDKSKAKTGHLVTLSSPHPVLLSAFNRYALLKAHAKAYVRTGQQRLVLKPLADRLVQYWGEHGVAAMLRRLPALLRDSRQVHESPLTDGYAAANLLHLLLHFNQRLAEFDFSTLTLRQACLQSAILHDVNFTGVNLQKCNFTDAFFGISTLAFHPTNGLLVTGGFDGAICTWQIDGGGLYEVRPEHGQTLYTVALSPDGTTLASSGLDQRICVWDWATHALRYTLHEHRNFARWIAFSPNNRWLAVAGGEGALKFYEVASAQLVHTLVTPSQWLWSIAFSPDGTLVAASSLEGQIYLWSLDQQMAPVGAMRTLPGHRAAIDKLLFSHDSRTLFSAGDDNLIHQWQLADGESYQPWRTLHGHTRNVRALALSPNGHLLASGGHDQTVRLWNVQTGELLETLVGHEQWVWAVAFQPRPAGNHPVLVSSGGDQRIFIWEIAAQADWGGGRLRHILQGYADAIHGVTFHPNGQSLISGGFDKLVQTWDVQTGCSQQMLRGFTEWIINVAVDRVGRFIVGSGYGTQVHLWHTKATAQVTDPAMADAAMLYVDQSQIIDTGHTVNVSSVAFAPNGQLLASGSQDQTIRLWDLRDPAMGIPLRQSLTGHTGWVWSVDFSPNGRWLASGSFDQTIRLWDVSKFNETIATEASLFHTFTGHESVIWGVAFSPDSRYLVSCSSDRSVRIWEIENQSCRVLNGHTSLVRAVAVSPTAVAGRITLASCDDDRCIRIWDLESGATIHQLYGHPSFIHRLAYSPDGTTLASAGEKGEILLWDVQSGAALRTLQIRKPYSGMNITGVTGITPAQKAALLALGAVEREAR